MWHGAARGHVAARPWGRQAAPRRSGPPGVSLRQGRARRHGEGCLIRACGRPRALPMSSLTGNLTINCFLAAWFELDFRSPVTKLHVTAHTQAYGTSFVNTW